MASFTNILENPEFTSHYEGVVIAAHCLLKAKGYEIFTEDSCAALNPMGLPVTFNQRAPTNWALHYSHPNKKNELYVSFAMWGEKMLVVLDELAMAPLPGTIGPPQRQSIRRTQFGIQADKYKVEGTSVATAKGWETLAHLDSLEKVFNECADPFLEKIPPNPVE